jgi:acetyl esterase
MARDAGGPVIAHQVLIYPDLDFRRSNVSIREFAGKYGNISRATQHWFMDHYLTGEHEKLDPHVSPLLAPNLEDLPTAYNFTEEFHTLSDEVEKYGSRLREAWFRTTVISYDGMIHEFIRGPFDDAGRALDDIAAALAQAPVSPRD